MLIDALIILVSFATGWFIRAAIDAAIDQTEDWRGPGTFALLGVVLLVYLLSL